MKIFVGKNKKIAGNKAFEIIKNQVSKKPDSLIGLAVGKTTDDLYKLISSDVKINPKFWKKIKVFQIDEYLGIRPKSRLSFNHEIKRELKTLFKVLNKKNIFLIDGTKKSETTIQEAYKFIKKNRGIDLIILGVGPEYDPHIAFNTSGYSSLNSRMRVVELHPKTVSVIARRHISADEAIPCEFTSRLLRRGFAAPRNDIKGITLSIKDILECKKALLIAYGKEKAKSIKLALNGKPNIKKVPASALQLHKDLEVVLDKEAARLI